MIAMKQDRKAYERSLIVLAQSGNLAARNNLIEMHQRFVWKTARKIERTNIRTMKEAGLEVEDLFQVGVMSLIRSIERFNLDQDVFLLTYAGLGVIRAMLREIEVRSRSSLDACSLDYCESDASPLSALLTARETTEDDVLRRETVRVVRESLNSLPERQRCILDMRINDCTLHEVGEVLGVTRERVRQLQNKAFSQLSLPAGVI